MRSLNKGIDLARGRNGAEGMRWNKKRKVHCNGYEIKEGDWISLNGSTGEVYLGQVATQAADPPAIAAPGRPEIHQNGLFAPGRLLKLLLIHII